MVGNSTNALNLNFNQITIIEITRFLHAHGDTSRRTCHDDGALFQGCALRDKGYNFRDVEQQIRGVCGLSDLAIDSGLEIKRRTLAKKLVGNDNRTDGGKLVKAFTEAPLGNTASVLGIFLPESVGDIIAHSVASNVF